MAEAERTLYVTDHPDVTAIDAATWQRATLDDPPRELVTDESPARALYVFAGDGPGDSNGDGLAGVWHVWDGGVVELEQDEPYAEYEPAESDE